LRRATLEADQLPSSIRQGIRRVFGDELNVEAVVDRILADVRAEGDAAVLRYNREIDGATPSAGDSLEVSPPEAEEAYAKADPQVVAALRWAADRIEEFHQRQLKHSLRSFQEDGLGQVVRPLSRVGIYVPGTKAVYPSTVLMTAIPARVAGVDEVIMATPTMEDGRVSPLKLVAAAIAGVRSVFRAGGVQGIAAMAYGTQSIPRVDKICGPGNIFVTAAKRHLYGLVGIDGIYGPSETVVVADGSAEPTLVAADLLAAAEHDELATAILITTSERAANAILAELRHQVADLERGGVARAALEGNGGIVVADSLNEAVALADEFAPEHLCLHVDDAKGVLDRIRNAGSIFVGGLSAEALGDYVAGPSHVLPTGGSARFASPLGVQAFLKVTSVVSLDEKAVSRLGAPAAAIARAEGFSGHARAIERRLQEQR
jgi:histidinol dehydrogenase